MAFIHQAGKGVDVLSLHRRAGFDGALVFGHHVAGAFLQMLAQIRHRDDLRLIETAKRFCVQRVRRRLAFFKPRLVAAIGEFPPHARMDEDKGPSLRNVDDLIAQIMRVQGQRFALIGEPNRHLVHDSARHTDIVIFDRAGMFGDVDWRC